MTRNRTYKMKTGHRGHSSVSKRNLKENTKECYVCKEHFERNIYISGRLETYTRFYERKTCSKECKRILISGKGNPNYKGNMHIKCLYCGKDNLSAPKKGKTHPDKCGQCYMKNINKYRKL